MRKCKWCGVPTEGDTPSSCAGRYACRECKVMEECVRERPIIFRDAMVCAILAGRKTQTRRVVKPQPVAWSGQDDLAALPFIEHGEVVRFRDGTDEVVEVPCPYGQLGDRLWVRETWSLACDLDGVPKDIEHVYYRADPDSDRIEGVGERRDGSQRSPWRPSIHMRREWSRLSLTITDVRVQRVQDITEQDAAAEGVEPMVVLPGDVLSHVASFGMLWDSINHARAPWDANPWVWALTFEVTP